MAEESMTGGCACGRIRFTARVDSIEAYLCHCRMCQRACGNVSLALKTVEQSDVEWATPPDWYHSSPIAERPYCRECGTSLGFRYKEDTSKMDLTVASFDDPSRFRPAHHFAAERIHEAWLDTSHLPRTRTDEYQRLIYRWINATGRMPD